VVEPVETTAPAVDKACTTPSRKRLGRLARLTRSRTASTSSLPEPVGASLLGPP